jgi:hypothetical protein
VKYVSEQPVPRTLCDFLNGISPDEHEKGVSLVKITDYCVQTGFIRASVTPSIVQEANLKCHEADASATLLPDSSHFVLFGERVQTVVIRLMLGTQTRDAIACHRAGGVVHCFVIG